ncbi:MAG: TonB-dependent siderophore receptor, partial [Rubrivivax sp.]
MSSKVNSPKAATPLMPLGALAAGVGLSLLSSAAMAQSAVPEATAGQTLPPVTVKDKADPRPEAKDDYRTFTTTIGKGNQAVRDIPQSMTVHTERLIDDRNLDDFRDVLRATAGVTFQAGETGEEDVRLRGFSLFQAGDIYVDGLRDPALQERDTFNHDRIEVLKGSASMLFGRGSTGGVVNQVSKQPFLLTQHEVEATVGSGKDYRLTGDFNIKTGESSAFRINAMVQDADKWGASVDKKGIAPTYRFGIGEKNEFSVGLYHL